MLLRDYQKAGNDRALLAKRAGKRRILLVSPTGSGKTVQYIDLIMRALRAGLRVGVVAHRRELITQPAKKFKALGIAFGVIMAGVRPDPAAPVQLLSVQAITAREWAPELDVLIIDEAHHATAATYAAIVAAYPHAVIFGFTATPERGDGTPLGDVFEEMIVVTTVAEMQELFRTSGGREGLCPVEHIGPIGGKKFTAAQGMADDPVKMYQQLCKGERRVLPAIFFGATVNHAYDLAFQLKAAGFRAACVEGEMRERPAGMTKYRARDQYLEDFQRGALDALTNVFCLTEGTDLPRAAVCGVARGCEVWSAWGQMGGRVLRPDPSSGKTKGWILDPYGHTYEHGLLSDTPEFSLTGRAASLKEPLSAIRSCRACGMAFRASATKCPRCGAFVPLPPTPKVKAKPVATGALTSVTVADYGKQWAEFCRLIWIAELNGHKAASAGYAFERQFGHWPRFRREKWDEALRLARARIKEDRARAANQTSA